MFPTDSCFIIAEAGVNHNGDLDMARRLVDAACKAGADAVKFQTFRAERLASRHARKVAYQERQTGGTEGQFEMLRRLELRTEDYASLQTYCHEKGIHFLSTPFDEQSADLLDSLVPVFKIPSGEVDNLPFLRHIAKKKKPVILSTGMSTLAEVAEAVDTLQSSGTETLVLLHCTTNYPAPFREVNLRAMITLRDAFRLPTGYSDHTPGINIPIAAAALGATVIEKHFTLDRTLPGPDHLASLEPDELCSMVQAVRNVEAALGSGKKQPTESERVLIGQVRKSIVAARDLPVGTVVTAENIAIKRPANGLSPRFSSVIVGHRLVKSAEMDEPLTWDHFFQ